MERAKSMDVKGLQESPLVSAAAAARRPTRWWLAYLISMPVLLIVVGAIALIASSLLVPLGDRGIAGQFAEAFNSIVMFLALFLWVRYKEGGPVRSLGFLPGQALRLGARHSQRVAAGPARQAVNRVCNPGSRPTRLQ